MKGMINKTCPECGKDRYISLWNMENKYAESGPPSCRQCTNKKRNLKFGNRAKAARALRDWREKQNG